MTDRQKVGQTDKVYDIQTEGRTDRQKVGLADRSHNRQAEDRTDMQEERKTD